MAKNIFGYISALLVIISYLPYVLDIIKKKTKPHSYTWLIWSITQTIAIFGILQGHGGGPATYPLIIGSILCFAVFILSIFFGTKDITVLDSIVLFLALGAIFIWLKLNSLIFAVILVSIIDFLGYIPSFRKSYNNPWTETISAWIGFILSGCCGLLALNKINLLTSVYIITITSANIIISLICIVRRKQLPNLKPLNF
jgi:hypothetical protein